MPRKNVRRELTEIDDPEEDPRQGEKLTVSFSPFAAT
jgi:hypothetical protein